MPHPGRAHTSLSVNVLFERKDDQNPVRDALHRLHAAGTPGPQLRADVVDDRNAKSPYRMGETKVEVWKVDGDEDVGTVGASLRDQAPVCGKRLRQQTRHLNEAGH